MKQNNLCKECSEAYWFTSFAFGCVLTLFVANFSLNWVHSTGWCPSSSCLSMLAHSLLLLHSPVLNPRLRFLYVRSIVTILSLALRKGCRFLLLAPTNSLRKYSGSTESSWRFIRHKPLGLPWNRVGLSFTTNALVGRLRDPELDVSLLSKILCWQVSNIDYLPA